MAAQKGSDFLLKMDNGSGFVTVAGLTTKDVQISSGTVDITNQDSPSKWQELLAGAAIKKMTISGRGVFLGSAQERAVKQTVLDGTIKNWQVIVPGDGTYQGPFQVTQVQLTGQHNGEVNYDIRLDSAGAIVYS